MNDHDWLHVAAEKLEQSRALAAEVAHDEAAPVEVQWHALYILMLAEVLMHQAMQPFLAESTVIH